MAGDYLASERELAKLARDISMCVGRTTYSWTTMAKVVTLGPVSLGRLRKRLGDSGRRLVDDWTAAAQPASKKRT